MDLDALRANLQCIRQLVGPTRRVITVVKADAYGHGLRQIAALMMQSGTDMFGVANLAEAAAIQSVGLGWPILMLGACLPAEVESAVRDDVRPTLSSLTEAKWFSQAAVRQRRQVRVHLKIDTGMSRLGVAPEDALALVQSIRELPGLELEGLYTHFAAAENDVRFSKRQQQSFDRVVQAAIETGVRPEWIHAHNSAGLLSQPIGRCTAVRPGLLVYGLLPTTHRRIPPIVRDSLQPALAWKCRLSLVKSLPKGVTISYGRTLRTKQPLRVGILTAGYGDGYLRSAGERACVLVQGRRCRILGRITMDQMIVDLSAVAPVTSGEEVVLVGRQGDETITITELADWTGTIPWEVLTNITHRVPRVYLGGHAA